MAGCTARLGADDPDTLIGHGNLVMTQLRTDPCGPALRGLDANVAARRRVLGSRHPATLAADAAQAAAYERAAIALEQDLWEHMAASGRTTRRRSRCAPSWPGCGPRDRSRTR